MKTKIWIFLSIVLIASLLSFALNHFKPVQAPTETFTTLTGKKISPGNLRGKPVIVTFWATDCPSCLEEIPDLITLYSQYHAKGLEIIAVAMTYNPPNLVVELTKEQALPYDVALDLKNEHSKAFGDVFATPTTFLIAPNGTIAWKKTGRFELKKMKNLIETLLKG